MKRKYGEKLKELRGEKSREQVAKDLGISVSSVQMYENSERVPRDYMKIKIAKYFKTTVQEIFFN